MCRRPCSPAQRGDRVKRRSFIGMLGGAVAAAGGAREQAERMRRVGVLMLYAENDPEGQVRATAFQRGLEKGGWRIGRIFRSTTVGAWATPADTIRVRGTADTDAGRDPRQWRSGGAGGAAGDRHGSYRIHRGRRSGCRWLRAKSGTPGWQHHRFHDLGDKRRREAVGAAQGGCAGGHARRGLVERGQSRFPRLAESAAAAAREFAVDVVAVPIREPAEIEAAVVRLGGEPGSDSSYPGPLYEHAPQVNCRTGGALPRAGDPYIACSCRRRRLDVLWRRCPGPAPARGSVCRSHPEGRESCRPCRFSCRPSSSS